MEYIFKTGSPEKVSLYRFDQEKNKRQFEIETAMRGKIQPIKGLPVQVETFGERSYKLVPAAPLTPGEYAIIIGEELYTFGVDQ
jgi:hypothetical protein